LTKENAAAAAASLVTMSAGGSHHLDLSLHAMAGLPHHFKVHKCGTCDEPIVALPQMHMLICYFCNLLFLQSLAGSGASCWTSRTQGFRAA